MTGEHDHQRDDQQRRRAARLNARGRVVIHGERHGRGKILDLSAAGVRLRLAGPIAGYRVADTLALDLRFDGARGGWWSLTGRIVRIEAENEVVIEFDDVPEGFADWIRAELHATLEARGVVDVLLVDPDAGRRARTAEVLRTAGHRVSEAATPLDAIDQLGESLYRPAIVEIADTEPGAIADDLRSYVRGEHPELVVRKKR